MASCPDAAGVDAEVRRHISDERFNKPDIIDNVTGRIRTEAKVDTLDVRDNCVRIQCAIIEPCLGLDCKSIGVVPRKSEDQRRGFGRIVELGDVKSVDSRVARRVCGSVLYACAIRNQFSWQRPAAAR